MKQYALVTVSDSLTNVSMPYNEFALYRQEHYPDCRHFYIVLFDSFVSKTVPYPENLTVFRCGASLPRLRKAVREIREQCPSLVTVDNTEEGWILAVRGLSRMDRGKLENIGNANREAAERFFSLRGMHLQYDAVYAGVLGMNQE